MKKFLVVVAVVAFAAPAFGAANPFIDVPLNHWAYDAIAQLYATGTIGGYPDGTYRGSNPMTRYEIAALVARALASVDMRKADKAQVDELRKLVIEFGEELEALGVRDSGGGSVLDGKFGERLGGWKISGWLRVDADAWKTGTPLAPGGGYNVNSGSFGNSSIPRSRIIFDKWWGEDDAYHLHARLSENGGVAANAVRFQYFWVEMPGWWNSTVTVGRFNRDYTGAYNWNLGSSLTDRGFYSIVSDVDRDGFAFDKSFAMSTFKSYIAKTPVLGVGLGSIDGPSDKAVSAWELGAIGSLQFSEKVGFDIGTQAWFLADDRGEKVDQYENAWTFYGGLRFNLNDNAAFKGIYYYQQASLSESDNPDAAMMWKAIVDIRQEMLKFTSIWVEYGMAEEGFVHPNGTQKQYFIDSSNWGSSVSGGGGSHFPEDVGILRVAGKQRWNDKWSTWLAFSKITGTDAKNFDTSQYAVGIERIITPNVGAGLGFVNTTVDEKTPGVGEKPDNRYLFFRTQVTF